MTKSQKITLSASRDIPFNKLVLCQSNVRRVKAGVSIEELAEDIARRTLLASITVRPVLDADGAETGIFEIPAGGRRYRALELLVKQKRLNRTALVPCIVRTEGLAEEDSLAENVQRAPLHPLDQFRAFQAMREKGRSEEEIAAAFFVSAGVVKQRLKLAAIAPALLDAYAEEEMTLDQLMAFTVNPDHEQQAQVWEAIRRGYSKQPFEIRRMLTEGAVRASDRRALFVGLEAYEAAGGAVLRDLFAADHGGWLQDAGLLERLAAEKLASEADAIRAEGWKWVEAQPDLPYGYHYDLRRIVGESEPLTEEEAARLEALKTEYETLEDALAGAGELPEDVDIRLGEIETAMEALQDRPARFADDERSIAGVFVSIGNDGRLRVERGFVRPEDEPAIDASDEAGAPADEGLNAGKSGGAGDHPAADPEAGENELQPLSDRLLAELTAHRTLALREALAGDPHTAYIAALHAMALGRFYAYPLDSCVDVTAYCTAFGSQAPGLADTRYAQSLDASEESWAKRLPKRPEELWDALAAFDSDSRDRLFAYCVAMSVNAACEPHNKRPRALAHADVLAGILNLDMAAAGWRPTVENYFSRVTKARILEAVREAKGDEAADRIAGLKKPDMAAAAEELIEGTGWLPDVLRTPEPAPTVDPVDLEPVTDTAALAAAE